MATGVDLFKELEEEIDTSTDDTALLLDTLKPLIAEEDEVVLNNRFSRNENVLSATMLIGVGILVLWSVMTGVLAIFITCSLGQFFTFAVIVLTCLIVIHFVFLICAVVIFFKYKRKVHKIKADIMSGNIDDLPIGADPVTQLAMRRFKMRHRDKNFGEASAAATNLSRKVPNNFFRSVILRDKKPIFIAKRDRAYLKVLFISVKSVGMSISLLTALILAVEGLSLDTTNIETTFCWGGYIYLWIITVIVAIYSVLSLAAIHTFSLFEGFRKCRAGAVKE